MLIEFRVENFRSILDEQVLTMQADVSDDFEKQRPRKITGVNRKVLPVAAIYGANASGKSNILTAMAFMKNAVSDSHTSWKPHERISRDAFAWGKRKSEPSMFEMEFVLNKVRYRYGFCANDKEFLNEWLHSWHKGKEQKLMVRNKSTFKFSNQLGGENNLIKGITRPNSLFLSAAAQNFHPILSPIYFWFSSLIEVNFDKLQFRRSRFWDDLNSTNDVVASLVEDSMRISERSHVNSIDDLMKYIMSMMRIADLGIVEIRSRKSDNNQPRIEFRHQSESHDAWLPIYEESKGTQTIFQIAFPILKTLMLGGVLIIDELESSLHPVLAIELVRQFNDPETNKHNAQIIFSTHDTNLIGNNNLHTRLRRDQVWFTEKNDTGATKLYPLTDFHPQKNENLGLGYIQGRYGAVPFLGSSILKEIAVNEKKK